MASNKRTKKPMDTALVDSFVARLNAALGKDVPFTEVYNALTIDPRVRQPEAALIAKKFLGTGNASVTKKEAFRQIRSHHLFLIDYQAKSRAQAGKSAA